MPPVCETSDGEERRVGFELEFSGIDLAGASSAVARALGGEVTQSTEAEHSVSCDELGTFSVEVDWSFLKRHARESAEGEEKEWVAPLSEAAALLVPIEVVGPPIPLHKLAALDPMVDALREAGAQGTEESLIAAYGVHINPETPDTAPPVLLRYLRAFALLQWWLVDAHQVDPMRRVTPYINAWPEAYLRELMALEAPDQDTLIDSYLTHNPTRNRALDMLPLFAELDEQRVRAAVDDPRIKARPTFHYRLPNCLIEDPDWRLSNSWNLWCVVEELAWDEAALKELGQAFMAAQRPLIGASRGDWTAHVEEWLQDRASA